MVETELSLSSGELKKDKIGPKDINGNEAFEPQIVVREAGKGKTEKANLATSTQLMETVAGKSVALPNEAGPEEKLRKGKNLAAKSKEEIVEMKSLDDRDSRLAKSNRDVSDEKPVTREVEDEKMKVETEEKLRVGEESSDCLSSSSRRALKRTAQITPPPGKDTTKVEHFTFQPLFPIFAPRRLKVRRRQQYRCQMASGRRSFPRR